MPRVLLSLLMLCLVAASARAQSPVSAMVLGRDSLPLPGVTVQNMRSKAITITDNNGMFELAAESSDTILFRAIGYHPLALGADLVPSILFLRTQVVELLGVEVVTRSYQKDSIARRQEYHKGFNFRRPKFREMVTIMPMGIGIDIYKLYRGLSFKKNKKAEIFQSRLINYEHDQYIDQVFTAELVMRYTGFKGDSLNYFMKAYRPDYEFVRDLPAYDLLFYIRQSADKYRVEGNKPSPFVKED